MLQDNYSIEEIEPRFKLAVGLAIEGGKMALSAITKGITIHQKGRIDPVTSADKEIENFIVENIKKHFRDDRIIAEEQHIKNLRDLLTWVIDPIDGTVNYSHGYPHFCTSISLIQNTKTVACAVFDPVKQELFTAKKGGGAFLNGNKIKVSKNANPTRSLLATGFPYDMENPLNDNTREFIHFIRNFEGVRTNGSAVLDLCYVACGRLDGYWESGLKIWDVSAGTLLVEEAGGKVTDFEGNSYVLELLARPIVASNGKLHKFMLQLLKFAEEMQCILS